MHHKAIIFKGQTNYWEKKPFRRPKIETAEWIELSSCGAVAIVSHACEFCVLMTPGGHVGETWGRWADGSRRWALVFPQTLVVLPVRLHSDGRCYETKWKMTLQLSMQTKAWKLLRVCTFCRLVSRFQTQLKRLAHIMSVWSKRTVFLFLWTHL